MFDLWRQMTVEHIVGQSQGGYLREIRLAVSVQFPDLPAEAAEQLARQIDALNTVTACSFCNATTSRDITAKSMPELMREAGSTPEEVTAGLPKKLQDILQRKRDSVKWKLESVRDAFEQEVSAKLSGTPS
jgi:cytochrome c553